MNRPSLTLLLDALAPPAEGEWPPMPALQRLLSKGQREPLPADPLTTLLEHFQLNAEAAAPLSALGDGLAAQDGWWLCADPVHLVADRDQLFLSASRSLGVTQAEADALIAELNRTYAADGWRFFAPHPQRWYLRLPEALTIRCVPTFDAIGRRVGEVLPTGADAMGWQRVMTEVQMVLHGSPVNWQRESQGQLTINGLWFWGGGSFPQTTAECGWSSLNSDQPLGRGLAGLYALPDREVGERVLHHVTTASLEEAEATLFAPLLQRLEAGELSELVVELPRVGRWRVERKGLRRWWRRVRTLNQLLKGPA